MTPDVAEAVPAQVPDPWIDIPRLTQGQTLDVRALRHRNQRDYEIIVYIPTVIVVIAGLAVSFMSWDVGVTILGITLFLVFLKWCSWKLSLAYLNGNSIRVGPAQYPQIHVLVTQASATLGIDPPTVLVLQGHGLFEVLVMKFYSRRGHLILTSNLLDDLTERRSSRELMFYIGRQLGLIADGYFNWWTVKHGFGSLTMLFYLAWVRRCNLTADRVGLLVAGEIYAAEQAMLILSVGSAIAPYTNLEAIREQRAGVREDSWARLRLLFSSWPYLVDRIVQLREFAIVAAHAGLSAQAPVSIGALPLHHRSIRSVRIMVVHGHDTEARLDLENLLLRRYPHVAPVVMLRQTDGAPTLPEKFERLAGEVKGAIVIVTPDEVVVTNRTGAESDRPRPNVIYELGWMVSKLGRQRCMLLMRGKVELPSDLQGVEYYRFESAPTECAEAVGEFIARLEA